MSATSAEPGSSDLSNRLERGAERVSRRVGYAILATRFVMAPFYLGLLVWLCLLTVKFVQKLLNYATSIFAMTENETILAGLSLIDFALVANLVVVVIFAAWHNLIGSMVEGHSRHGPMATIGAEFSNAKLKLIASIVVIASVQILETFVHISETPTHDALWRLAILVGLALTGVLLAGMDRLRNDHH
jgi:uncharacterized protein (TIGR00645 family)